MNDLNKVIIQGRLTDDPKPQQIDNGTLTKLSIASNRSYKKGDEEQKEVCYVNVDAWGKLAETVAKHLSKGDSVTIEGKLDFSQWEDKQTQAKRSALAVRAQQMHFHKVKKWNESENAPEGVAQSSDGDDLSF